MQKKKIKCESYCVKSVKRADVLLFKLLIIKSKTFNNHLIDNHMLVFFALKMVLFITLKKENIWLQLESIKQKMGKLNFMFR